MNLHMCAKFGANWLSRLVVFPEFMLNGIYAGMEPAGSPVTVMDGGFSSPDAPRGTGGPKSK